jgi:hypothetical protein
MVLGSRQWQDGTSISNCQHADFLTFKSFFDDHGKSGFAKFIFSPHAIDRIKNLFSAGAHDNTFATCEPIRFDD